MVKARAILKQRGKENVEITRHKGFYYILHICKNNTPVPLFYSKDIENIIEYCEIF